MLSVCHAVQIPWHSNTAVIVSKPTTVSVIPMVEVGAYAAVDVKIERNHHVLASLVNSKHIISTYNVTTRRTNVGIKVEFLAELFQSVLLCSCHALAVQGDVSVCLGTVLRALLCP